MNSGKLVSTAVSQSMLIATMTVHANTYSNNT